MMDEPWPENMSFDMLAKYRFVKLSTYRANGQLVSSPVLFALENGKMYVTSGAKSWKEKRIKNNPNVKVEPCTSRGRSLGHSIDAIARVMSYDESHTARRSLLRRHRILRRLLDYSLSLRGIRREYLEISPSS